jgi:hypothetical protein
VPTRPPITSITKLRSPMAIEQVRGRIQVSMILTHLAQHVAGTRDMSPTQITAAKILLDKSLPSLVSTTINGEGGAPIRIVVSKDDAALL